MSPPLPRDLLECRPIFYLSFIPSPFLETWVHKYICSMNDCVKSINYDKKIILAPLINSVVLKKKWCTPFCKIL